MQALKQARDRLTQSATAFAAVRFWTSGLNASAFERDRILRTHSFNMEIGQPERTRTRLGYGVLGPREPPLRLLELGAERDKAMVGRLVDRLTDAERKSLPRDEPHIGRSQRRELRAILQEHFKELLSAGVVLADDTGDSVDISGGVGAAASVSASAATDVKRGDERSERVDGREDVAVRTVPFRLTCDSAELKRFTSHALPVYSVSAQLMDALDLYERRHTQAVTRPLLLLLACERPLTESERYYGQFICEQLTVATADPFECSLPDGKVRAALCVIVAVGSPISVLTFALRVCFPVGLALPAGGALSVPIRGDVWRRTFSAGAERQHSIQRRASVLSLYDFCQGVRMSHPPSSSHIALVVLTAKCTAFWRLFALCLVWTL